MSSEPTATLVRRILAAPRPRAFVLSGGGAYGAVQVGMLRALNEAGVVPDLVVGASVGALNGVFVAHDPESAADKLTEIWSSVNASTVFGTSGRGRSSLTMLRQLVRSRSSLVSPQAINDLITSRVPAAQFSELSLPFHAIATDHLTGEIVVLQTGDLEPALAASSAIPGVLPARDIGGRRLVDGGVVAMFPTQTARQLGAGSIILLDATPTDARTDPPRGLPSGLIHTVALMIRAQRHASTNSEAIGCEIFTLPSATPPDATAFDFRRTVSLINDGYQRTTGHLHG